MVVDVGWKGGEEVLAVVKQRVSVLMVLCIRDPLIHVASDQFRRDVVYLIVLPS